MRLASPAYDSGSVIPDRFTCKGQNISPPLRIQDMPPGTQSLCFIMHDPDAPSGDFVHWVGYDIAPTDVIPEGSRPGKQGVNDFGDLGYGGPCPPSGTHRYIIQAYALDVMLGLPDGKKRAEIEAALQDHVLAAAELMGKVSAAG